MRRWATLVAVIAAGIAGSAAIVHLRPVSDPAIDAATLLSRIQASADVPYSGYVESLGGLSLPADDRFADIAQLLGDRTRVRVWYAAPDASRVDAITATGETDVYTDAHGTWTWSYEDRSLARESQSVDPAAIPQPSDLLPPPLARRLLSGAAASDVSRIGAQRIAGHDAAGLRLIPSAPQSTVGRVDVWADADTGLPLRVAVYPKAPPGASGSRATMDSAFLDVSLDRPTTDLVTFDPPAGVPVTEQPNDLLSQLLSRAGAFAGQLPDQLGGLPRTDDRSISSVGVYGQGIAAFAAVRIPGRASRTLAEALSSAPGAVDDGSGVAVASGAVSVVLTRPAADDNAARWLLSGPVDVATLQSAAATIRQLQVPR